MARGVGGFIVLASYVLVWSWKVPIDLASFFISSLPPEAPGVVIFRYSVNNLMPERPYSMYPHLAFYWASTLRPFHASFFSRAKIL